MNWFSHRNFMYCTAQLAFHVFIFYCTHFNRLMLIPWIIYLCLCFCLKGPCQWIPRQYTAKTKCRKLETNIPRKEISGPQSQFPHSCVCERIIYCIPTMGLPVLLEEICRLILGIQYKNRSKTHKCGNWSWGRAIPRKGIYKRNCRCSVVAESLR